MGQEISRRRSVTPARQAEPSWPAVASTTARLWLERHHRYPVGRRKRLVLALSALLAMSLGAGVTLAFTQRGPGPTVSRPSRSGQGSTALQVAAADRHQAAVWIALQVESSAVVGCDPEMCNELQQSGFPAGQLDELQ